MKKIIRLIVLVLFSTIFIGCSFQREGDSIGIEAPTNKKLDIDGSWETNGYKILDENIATNEAICEVLAAPVYIEENMICIGGQEYDKVNYKLKYVDLDYEISYEAKITMKDLGFNYNGIKTYSITYDNNLLCEIINEDDDNSYLYYQGILFNIIKKETDEKEVSEKKGKVSNQYDAKNYSSQGILLGLKVPSEDDKDNIREKYRTIWICRKSGQLQSIRENSNIIIPRTTGLWTLKTKEIEDVTKKIYVELLEPDSIEYNEHSVVASDGEVELTEDAFKDNTDIRLRINYIGNNYVAIDEESTVAGVNKSVYKVLPIDSVITEKGIDIQDIFPSDASTFAKSYKSAYYKLEAKKRSDYTEEVDYSNFTIYRTNGTWALKGRISDNNSNNQPIDFPLGIKINETLCSYDTLIIPWKVLKAEIPLLVDAYTSPDGTMAIIITTEEIEVYEIEDGRLKGEPLSKISLKNQESVIMAQWCENSYVSKWDNVLSKRGKIIG